MLQALEHSPFPILSNNGSTELKGESDADLTIVTTKPTLGLVSSQESLTRLNTKVLYRLCKLFLNRLLYIFSLDTPHIVKKGRGNDNHQEYISAREGISRIAEWRECAFCPSNYGYVHYDSPAMDLMPGSQEFADINVCSAPKGKGPKNGSRRFPAG